MTTLEQELEKALRDLTKTARTRIRKTLNSDQRVLSRCWIMTMQDGEVCGCLLTNGYAKEALALGYVMPLLGVKYRMPTRTAVARLTAAATAYDYWVGDTGYCRLERSNGPHVVWALSDNGKTEIIKILDRIDR